MFTLPSDPNPLSGLLTAAIGGVQAHGKQQVQQGELQRVLSGLNAESSPMDWFKAIEGVRDPEVKANLREGCKQHLESEKSGQSQRQAAQAAQTKQQEAEENRQHREKLQNERQDRIDARIQKRVDADLDAARKLGINIPGEQGTQRAAQNMQPIQRQEQSQLQSQQLPQQQPQEPAQIQPNQAPEAEGEIDYNKPQSWTDDEIVKLRGLSGNKGALGQIGRIAEAEAERRKLIKIEEQKIAADERAIERSGHKKFFETVESNRESIPDQQFSNAMILDAVNKGDVDPWSWGHVADMAKALGFSESLTNMLETPGSKEFKTGLKSFIAGTLRESFRGTTNQREIQLAESMLTQIGVSKEGNLAAAWAIQSGLDIKEEQVRLVDEAKEQGIAPSKIPAYVDKKLKSYREQVGKEYFEAVNSLRKK